MINISLQFFLISIGLIIGFGSGITQGSQKIIGYCDGYLTFSDLYSTNVKKVKLDHEPKIILTSLNGMRYLLTFSEPNHPAYIYDTNSIKLNEVSLTGEVIAISDQGDVILREISKNNESGWQIISNTGLLMLKMPDNVKIDMAVFTSRGEIIAWTNPDNCQSVLAVFNRKGNKIYQKVFDRHFGKIEQVVPITGSKVAVFTSYALFTDCDYCDEPKWTIFYFLIDFSKEVEVSSKFMNSNLPIRLEAVASGNGSFVGGAINNSKAFVMDVVSHKAVFFELQKLFNMIGKSSILQIGVSDDGTLHILRKFGEINGFITFEKYKNGNTTKTQIVEEVWSNAKPLINRTETTTTDCSENVGAFNGQPSFP